MLNKKVEMHIPFGAVGIRCTDFWAGPSRGVYGVLLLEGAISDFTDAGGHLITTPGTGVNPTGRDALPSEATLWGTGRVEEALAKSAFK